MKKVLIIRHAKSDWGGIGVRDFDRGLNARGLRDAPEMADRIIKKQIAIDAFISSTAKRAFTTASFFVHAYNAANKTSLNIIEEPTLYHAPPEIFYEIIKRLNNQLNAIAIFAHNPGITDFANELTNTRIDDMPTSGIFAVEVASNSWLEFAKAKKRFWFFEYPKLGG